MQKVIVESGIPVPEPGEGRGRMLLYPELYSMAIGESFAVPLAKRQEVTNAANHCRIKTGRQFRSKTMGDTYRVWHIAGEQ